MLGAGSTDFTTAETPQGGAIRANSNSILAIRSPRNVIARKAPARAPARTSRTFFLPAGSANDDSITANADDPYSYCQSTPCGLPAISDSGHSPAERAVGVEGVEYCDSALTRVIVSGTHHSANLTAVSQMSQPASRLSTEPVQTYVERMSIGSSGLE